MIWKMTNSKHQNKIQRTKINQYKILLYALFCLLYINRHGTWACITSFTEHQHIRFEKMPARTHFLDVSFFIPLIMVQVETEEQFYIKTKGTLFGELVPTCHVFQLTAVPLPSVISDSIKLKSLLSKTSNHSGTIPTAIWIWSESSPMIYFQVCPIVWSDSLGRS